MEPTLVDGISPRADLAQNEVFGPIAVLLPARDVDEAVAIANDVSYGLAAAVFTTDLDRASGRLRTARSGDGEGQRAHLGCRFLCPFRRYQGLELRPPRTRQSGPGLLHVVTDHHGLPRPGVTQRPSAGVTVASTVLRALGAAGASTVFGLPGTHNMAFWGTAEEGPRPRLVNVRHEQTAVYAADGWARASGRLGAALVTTGPGAANTLAAFGEAAMSGSPLVLVASEVPIGGGRSRYATYAAPVQRPGRHVPVSG